MTKPTNPFAEFLDKIEAAGGHIELERGRNIDGKMGTLRDLGYFGPGEDTPCWVPGAREWEFRARLAQLKAEDKEPQNDFEREFERMQKDNLIHAARWASWVKHGTEDMWESWMCYPWRLKSTGEYPPLMWGWADIDGQRVISVTHENPVQASWEHSPETVARVLGENPEAPPPPAFTPLRNKLTR